MLEKIGHKLRFILPLRQFSRSIWFFLIVNLYFYYHKLFVIRKVFFCRFCLWDKRRVNKYKWNRGIKQVLSPKRRGEQTSFIILLCFLSFVRPLGRKNWWRNFSNQFLCVWKICNLLTGVDSSEKKRKKTWGVKYVKWFDL